MARGAWRDHSREITPLGASPIHISDPNSFGENRRLARKGWHVSLRVSRESIEKNGIDHKIIGSGGTNVFSDNRDQVGRRPRQGNYIFLHEQDALDFAEPGIHDIWEVDIPEERQHMFFHDRGLGPNYSGQSPRKIPKKSLTLLHLEGPPSPEASEKFNKKINYVNRLLNNGQFND